jgi:DNA-binding transcriptional regulator YiaG
MIDLKTLSENPDLAKSIRVEMTAAALIEFSDQVAQKAIAASKKQVPLIPKEEYLTSEEMAKTLKISLVTLWSWDKKGITQPLKIGNQKRYRRSDLEKFLSHES